MLITSGSLRVNRTLPTPDRHTATWNWKLLKKYFEVNPQKVRVIPIVRSNLFHFLRKLFDRART